MLINVDTGSKLLTILFNSSKALTRVVGYLPIISFILVSIETYYFIYYGICLNDEELLVGANTGKASSS